MAQEFHGVWQFLDSDEESDKETVFKKPEYNPKIVTEAYFLSEIESNLENITGKFSMRDLDNAVHYLYMKQDYSKALELCDLILSKTKLTLKKSENRELREVASKCCLKLGNQERALEFMEFADTRTEPGVIRYYAYLLGINGKYVESFIKYCECQKQRPGDFMNWKEQSDLILRISLNYDAETSNYLRKIAAKWLDYAIHLATNRSTVPNSYFFKKFQEKVAALKEERLEIEFKEPSSHSLPLELSNLILKLDDYTKIED